MSRKGFPFGENFVDETVPFLFAPLLSMLADKKDMQPLRVERYVSPKWW